MTNAISTLLIYLLWFFAFPWTGFALMLFDCGWSAFSGVEKIAAFILPFVGQYLFWTC